MSSFDESFNTDKILAFLREWDRADQATRSRLLSGFVRHNSEATLEELELQFAQVASLFLARLTTWMRLTYASGTYLGVQLKAIGIFLSASNQDQYLMEFIADGGALTLLEILTLAESKEEDKMDALRLLLTISDAGRSCKEILCESNGVNAITECLSKCDTKEIQETACAVLECLSCGNPNYQDETYRALIALMACRSPRTQQLVLQTLRTVQSKMLSAHHSVVEPLLSTLQSLFIEVHEEAIDLILELRRFDVRPVLLSGLVTLLRPTVEENPEYDNTEVPDMTKMSGCLPVFVQQASAAKSIRLLAEDSYDITQEFLALGVIQHLLYAMANREYVDSQTQASLALKHFVNLFPVVGECVQTVLGDTLFDAFLMDTENLFMIIDESVAEILLSNNVNITEVLDGSNVEG